MLNLLISTSLKYFLEATYKLTPGKRKSLSWFHFHNVHNLSLAHPKVQNYLQTIDSPGPMTHSHQLTQIVRSIREKQLELNELEKLSSENPELKEMARTDSVSIRQSLSELEAQFFESVIEPDELDLSTNEIIFELSAGVGGQEAMLFTQELFNMYINFIHSKGWESDLLVQGVSEMGGLRHATLSVSGPFVYSLLKYEAGVHRVQRVPQTEKSGRIHTSTAAIAVLPSPSEIQVEIPPKDLKFETKRASGAGGQHVNTTESAVRITHLPTGISIDSQMERSQIRNRENGLRLLRTKLYEIQLNKQEASRKQVKRLQVGFANRNEKIRTYNFTQDRITDHRIGATLFNLPNFMLGGKELEGLIKKLRQFEHDEKLVQRFS